tara:strand:- start:616 stop:1056 length:441 start_codon:yes stop_codon:yes gene_type:complete
MDIGFILFCGMVLIGLIILFGKFINENAEAIFGKSFITIILKRIGFLAENIDMIILIIISITGMIVFIILNDVKLQNIDENKVIEKHKIDITNISNNKSDIFRSSGSINPLENFEVERMFSSGKYHTNCNEISDEKKRSKCLLYNN